MRLAPAMTAEKLGMERKAMKKGCTDLRTRRLLTAVRFGFVDDVRTRPAVDC